MGVLSVLCSKHIPTMSNYGVFSALNGTYKMVVEKFEILASSESLDTVHLLKSEIFTSRA